MSGTPNVEIVGCIEQSFNRMKDQIDLLTLKLYGGQVVEEAVIVVDHGEVVEGALLLLRLLVEVLLLEDAVVMIEVVDDLDEPVTVR